MREVIIEVEIEEVACVTVWTVLSWDKTDFQEPLGQLLDWINSRTLSSRVEQVHLAQYT
jgi:hypothetical protein